MATCLECEDIGNSLSCDGTWIHGGLWEAIDEIAEQIENGEGDEELLKLAKTVDLENNPPAWVEDEDIWDRAKEAVLGTATPSEKTVSKSKYDEPWGVIAHVYQKLGGGLKASEE